MEESRAVYIFQVNDVLSYFISRNGGEADDEFARERLAGWDWGSQTLCVIGLLFWQSNYSTCNSPFTKDLFFHARILV